MTHFYEVLFLRIDGNNVENSAMDFIGGGPHQSTRGSVHAVSNTTLQLIVHRITGFVDLLHGNLNLCFLWLDSNRL
jgi:hypothetical protein